MKITIRNPETFGTFSFPCGDDALENLMKQFYPQAIETRTIPVHEIVAPREFAFLNGQEIDLDELNFLAKYNDRFDNREGAEYFALIQLKHPKSVKDLINLSEYKDRGYYVLIRNVSDPQKVGRRFCLETGEPIIPNQYSDDELTRIGRELLNSGKGTVTEYGILFPNDKKIEKERRSSIREEPFYNGKTFPDYYYESYIANIRIQHGNAEEYLYFPDDETAIARALRRVGVSSIDDCMENATVLLGNHELMMLQTFSGEYDLHDPFFPIFANRSAWKLWKHNGGWVTVNGLQGMSKDEIKSLMAKVNTLPISAQIEVNGTTYELVHGIPPEFYDEAWKWKTSKREFCTWERIEPDTPLFADRTVIFGHTPTCFYQDNEYLSIWYGDNRIGIDCGSGLGQVHYHGTLLHGRLACLRLDDGKEFYSETE